MTNAANVTTLHHGDRFRIGYTEYRVWTLGGFYIENKAEYARNEVRFGWTAPEWLATFPVYRAEQRRRGSADRGASPCPAVLVGDRALAARRAADFQALPELAVGAVIELEGARYTIAADHNNHLKFTEVAE